MENINSQMKSVYLKKNGLISFKCVLKKQKTKNNCFLYTQENWQTPSSTNTMQSTNTRYTGMLKAKCGWAV